MMGRYYNRPAEQRAEGEIYTGSTAAGVLRLDTHNEREPFHANWSGYTCPPEDDTTIAQLEGYYLHGQPVVYADGSHTDTPDPRDREKLLELGRPISGDAVALFRHWRTTHRWPRLRDVWASIGVGPDGEPPRQPRPRRRREPVQTTIFDVLEDA